MAVFETAPASNSVQQEAAELRTAGRVVEDAFTLIIADMNPRHDEIWVMMLHAQGVLAPGERERQEVLLRITMNILHIQERNDGAFRIERQRNGVLHLHGFDRARLAGE